jgi:aminoglycoside phosphotransferase (APT) family kinase protein
MRQRWSRPVPAVLVDIALAQGIVDRALAGVKVLAVTPIEGGLANTNVKLLLDRAPHAMLLRLYQRDPKQAEKEAAIVKRLKGAVPVPEFFYLGHDASGRRVALLEWIDGVRMETVLDGSTPARIDALGADAGRMLARIHSVTFEQSGFLDGSLNVATVLAVDPDFLVNYLRGSFIEGGGARFVSRELAEATIAFVKRNAHLKWDGPPRLTHCDYNGSNILVRGDEIAGVIDWEFAFAGPPSIDFGNLMRNHPDARFQDAVAEGYVAAGGQLPRDWRKHARISDLTSWAEFLHRPEVDPVLVQDALAAIKETIADAE